MAGVNEIGDRDDIYLNRIRMRSEPGDGGCLLWNGCLHTAGYGKVYVYGRVVLAHRAMYELTFGKIPDGLHVLHKCDVPRCVNPDHLFLGTNDDNIADKVQKARHPYGVGCYNAKLTAEFVRWGREKYFKGEMNATELAGMAGVGMQTMWNALTGRSWTHVSFPEVSGE